MTYLAPKQGRFAFVLLLLFCAHIGVFVFSSNAFLRKHNEQVADRLSGRLADELRLPLAIGDKIGLATAAGRFESDPALAYIGVYDASGELVLPLGQDTADAPIIERDIHEGDTRLGRVVVKSAPVGQATILASHWHFLVATAFFYALIWLLYGHLARPNSDLIEEIEARARLAPLPKPPKAAKTAAAPAAKPPSAATVDDFLRQAGAPSKERQDNAASVLQGANPNPDRQLIQIVFVDKHNMLDMLAHETASDYFRLCDQLLRQTLAVALADPKFIGFAIEEARPFGKRGATFCLRKTQAAAPLLAATATLLKLWAAVYETVYDKHRERGWFALPTCAIASDESRAALALKLAQSSCADAQEALLYGVHNTKPLRSSIELEGLTSDDPDAADCVRLGLVNEALAQKLAQWRAQILQNAHAAHHS